MPTIVCESCEQRKPEGDFSKDRSGRPCRQCKGCYVLMSTGKLPWAMPSARAERVMVSLREGFTLRRIFNPADAKPMCSPGEFKRYAAANPEWGQEAVRLAAANAKAAMALRGNWKRDWTHCAQGHDFATHGRLYREGNGRLTRRCQLCRAISQASGGVVKPVLIAVAKRRIEAGDPITSFTGGGRPGYLMSHETFSKARAIDPDLDAWVTLKTANNNSVGQRRRWAKAVERTAPGKIIRPALTGIIAAQPDRRYAAVDEAVSRKLPRDLRNEVMSQLIFELFEQRITLLDVPALAQKYTRKLYNTMNYGDLSLDAPAFREGATPWVETLSQEQGMWS